MQIATLVFWPQSRTGAPGVNKQWLKPSSRKCRGTQKVRIALEYFPLFFFSPDFLGLWPMFSADISSSERKKKRKKFWRMSQPHWLTASMASSALD